MIKCALKKFSFLLLILLFCSGCWFPFKKKIKEPPIVSTPSIGKVLKSKEVIKGGGIVVVPFRAGTGAQAGERLDKVSLMIIKGLSDYFENQDQTHFKILDADHSDQAKFFIEGFIEDWQEPSKIGKTVLFHKDAALAISADMRSTKTQERLVIFSLKKDIRLKRGDIFDLAYQMGQDMAQFLVAKSQETRK